MAFSQQLRLCGRILQAAAETYRGFEDASRLAEIGHAESGPEELVFAEFISTSRLSSPVRDYVGDHTVLQEAVPNDLSSGPVPERLPVHNREFTESDTTDAERPFWNGIALALAGSEQQSDQREEQCKWSVAAPKPGQRKRAYHHRCPVCDRPFGRRYNMQVHLQTHVSGRPKPYQCPTCASSFHRTHDLERHLIVHERKKRHSCGCGRAYSRKDALVRHQSLAKCKEFVGGTNEQ